MLSIRAAIFYCYSLTKLYKNRVRPLTHTQSVMSAVTKRVKNAFEVLTSMREYGVGKRVTRGIWSNYEEPSYWEVVRIRPSLDLKHGKVYGRFTFRGEWQCRGLPSIHA